MENEKNKLNIELKPEVARGSYSNLAIISHSHSEFVIDFATSLPGYPKPEICSRILMAPEHAKRLLNALAENVSKYEANFGKIELGGPQPGTTFNLADFNNPNGAKS